MPSAPAGRARCAAVRDVLARSSQAEWSWRGCDEEARRDEAGGKREPLGGGGGGVPGSPPGPRTAWRSAERHRNLVNRGLSCLDRGIQLLEDSIGSSVRLYVPLCLLAAKFFKSRALGLEVIDGFRRCG